MFPLDWHLSYSRHAKAGGMQAVQVPRLSKHAALPGTSNLSEWNTQCL